MSTSAAPAPAPTTPPVPTQQPLTEAELAAKVSKLIIKNNGDAAEAIQLVLDDNKTIRDHKRHLEAENTRLRESQVPQGGLALTAEQKAVWDKLAEMKVTTVDALTKLVTEHGTFKEEKEKADKARLIQDMATGKDEKGQPIGFDPKLLGELLNLKGMTGELKDAIVPDPTDATKTIAIKIPYVRPANNANAAGEPLTQYATRELSGFLDALRKAEAPQDQKGGRGRTTTPKPVPPSPITTTAPQTPGSQGADGNLGVANRVLAARYGDTFSKPGATK